MGKFLRDVGDGLTALFGPILMPRWLHYTVWTTIWAVWIIGAVGFLRERMAS